MSAAWEIASSGDGRTIFVFGREDGPDGRTVCVVPGNLTWCYAERGFVRRLDQQDHDNARLIAAAPRLRAALADLIEWSARTGGWDAPCWEEARAVLDALRKPPR